MGTFLNEIDVNLMIGSVVFVLIGAPVFGIFFNQLMDSLGEHEHTSLYVAIGVLVSLVLTATISWKAALLGLAVFTLTGIPMIVGEFRRTEKKRKSTPRRKRLPYAANGILDEAMMANTEALNKLQKAINATKPEDMYKLLVAAVLEQNTIASKLNEVKRIQLEK